MKRVMVLGLALFVFFSGVALYGQSAPAAEPPAAPPAAAAHSQPEGDHGIFASVTKWYLENLNFWTITLLMTVESSFIPFPSEIVIPPAAFMAKDIGELLLVILAGVLGSILGALINYWLAIWLGRPLIYKFADTKLAHLMLIDRAGVEKSEKFFLKYGNLATLIGRLVPAVRQLISLPAGLARMPMVPFLFFTFLGSAIWNTVLALIGFALKGQEQLFSAYYDELAWIMIGLGVAFVAWILLKVFVFDKKNKTPADQ